jgi:hypothetical protein
MFRIGLENNFEGRSEAWVLGHPGCFCYGKIDTDALNGIPQAIRDYRAWISNHTTDSWFPAGEEYMLEETWDCYSIDDDFQLANEGYEVNSWFRDDWIPLTMEEIQRGLLLLAWGREQLLDITSTLDSEKLNRTYPGERWSILGIVRHIGDGDWWYQDRFGLASPASQLPDEEFQRLEKIRANLLNFLPDMAGSKQVLGMEGEFWSPRKLLRRAVWHEYDHIAHIRKLL